MPQGVLYSDAQFYFLVGLAYQFGDATPTLHLYSSDDTPTPTVWPNTYTELSNDSYSPLAVPNGYWQSVTSPIEEHLAVIGAAWNLAGPGLTGDHTIFGWWLDGASPRAGETFYFYGGRFDSPIVIPPAGMTLNFGQLDLYLHDCGTPLPPPPPPTPYLRDTFQGVNGTLLPAHAMDVGPGWTTPGITQAMMLHSGTAVAAANAVCAAVTDAGAANWVLRVTYTHQSDTQPILLYRHQDDNNLWYSFNNGSTWNVTEVVAGSQTTRATNAFTLTAGVTYEFTLVVDGNSVTLAVNGALGVTYTGMTTFLTQTHLGLWVIPSGGTIPTGAWSNFRVDAV